MSLGESRGGGTGAGVVGVAHSFLNSERSRRKTMTLQLPLAALSAANVVDAKYDSDSDFDYRSKPPRYVIISTELIIFVFIRVHFG